MNHSKGKSRSSPTGEIARKGFLKALPLHRDALIAMLLLLTALIAYHPAWNGKPIWDDDRHITAPELRSFTGLEKIWTKLGATQQYYPLVHSVFWAEYRLWGIAPTGYHLINIFLHVFSSLLLYKILWRLTIPGAWLAAAIFALHPIEVESVAWISELKNCLSGVLFFCAILSYLQFDQRRTLKPYLVSFGLFGLGLMAKTAIAPMPAAMFIILWWKRNETGRLGWKKDLLPLLPFFLAGISFGLFTAWVERKIIIGKEDFNFNYSLIERCLIAGRAFWFYLGKLIIPWNLTFSYSRWQVSRAVWWQYFFPVGTAALACLFWIFRRRSKAPIVAMLYFIVMLSPALGFFNIFPFRYSFVADHFQYLAGLGPMVLASAGLSSALSSVKKRFTPAEGLVPVMILFTLAVLTWRQCGMYADVETLYRTTLQRNPSSGLAWNNLGISYLEKGQSENAIGCFRKALEINPKDFLVCNNLGIAFTNLGRREEAISEFKNAIAIWPDYDVAYCNLGNCLAGCGRTAEAIVYYQKAVDLDPGYIEALVNLGSTLVMNGRVEEGVTMFRKALAIDPGNVAALLNAGHALLQSGRANEAIVYYRKVLDKDPRSIPAFFNLGSALLQVGRINDAAGYFRKALEMNPGDVKILNDLCDVFMQIRQPDDAIRAAGKAMILAKSTGQEALAREIAGNIEEIRRSAKLSLKK